MVSADKRGRIIALGVVMVAGVIAYNSSGGKLGPSIQTAGEPAQTSSVTQPPQVTTGDEERIILNFRDNQLVLKGYPVIANDYVRIFHFVYEGMGADEEAFVAQASYALREHRGMYSYRASKSENRIFAGVGEDAEGKPIKQTIEIMDLAKYSTISNNCQQNQVSIGALQATALSCSSYSSIACWVPLNTQYAVFYQQHSANKIEGADMCENLRKNGIREMVIQEY